MRMAREDGYREATAYTVDGEDGFSLSGTMSTMRDAIEFQLEYEKEHPAEFTTIRAVEGILIDLGGKDEG